MSAATMIIDDRGSNTLAATNGVSWRVISDTVMGGVSSGSLVPTIVEGRDYLRMTGEVSLESNGGFVQASLDLSAAGLLDAGEYAGIEIEVFGNGETYNLHLRTDDTRIVWQSYRASFQALPNWQSLRLPFASFQPHRIASISLWIRASCVGWVWSLLAGRWRRISVSRGFCYTGEAGLFIKLAKFASLIPSTLLLLFPALLREPR